MPTSTTTLCFSTGDSRLSPASTDSAQSWRSYGAGSSYSRDAQAKPLIAAIRTAPEGMVDQPGNSRNPVTTRSRRNSVNNNNGGTYHWVTSSTLDGFKDKDVMRKVRKAAMDDHLRKNPKHSTRPHENRAHEQRAEDRIYSVGSGTSDDQEPSLTSNEWALQAIIGRSRRPSLQSDLTQLTADVLEDEDPPSESLAVRAPNSPQLGIGNIIPIPNHILVRTPVVVLPRPGPLPYDRVVIRSLRSLGAPLDPFRTMPQVSHPRVSIEELKTHCETYRFRTPSAFWRPGAIFGPAPLYQCSTNMNQAVGSSGQRRWD